MIRSGLALGLCLSLTAVAQAEDLTGRYSLRGKDSTGKATKVRLKIMRAGTAYGVERTSRIKGTQGQELWKSTTVNMLTPRVLEVTYDPGPFIIAKSEARAGLVHRVNQGGKWKYVAMKTANGFTPPPPPPPGRRFYHATYLVSPDGKIVELVEFSAGYHGKPAGHWIRTSGKRVGAAKPTTKRKRKVTKRKPKKPAKPLSKKEVVAKAKQTIKTRWAKKVRRIYAERLADAETAAEKKKLKKDLAADLVFKDVVAFVDADEYFTEQIDESYESGQPYRSGGKVVPKSQLLVLTVSMYPAYAGIGLGQSFVFDKRTGKLLEASDVSD